MKIPLTAGHNLVQACIIPSAAAAAGFPLMISCLMHPKGLPQRVTEPVFCSFRHYCASLSMTDSMMMPAVSTQPQGLMSHRAWLQYFIQWRPAMSDAALLCMWCCPALILAQNLQPVQQRSSPQTQSRLRCTATTTVTDAFAVLLLQCAGYV